MQPEPGQLSPLAQLVPAPVQVPRLDRRPDRRREHQPVLPPGAAQRQALSILPLLVLFEVAHREPGQHDGSPRAAGLRLGDLELAVHTPMARRTGSCREPRSMSSQRKASSSPRRRPVVSARTYRASSRSPSPLYKVRVRPRAIEAFDVQEPRIKAAPLRGAAGSASGPRSALRRPARRTPSHSTVRLAQISTPTRHAGRMRVPARSSRSGPARGRRVRRCLRSHCTSGPPGRLPRPLLQTCPGQAKIPMRCARVHG
jgi:hypothetical protein